MTDSSAEQAAAESKDPERPAFLELFFDLVYVLALITLAEKLAVDPSWAGAGQTLILLLTFTLLWALTVWAGDSFDLGSPRTQPQVVGIMAGSVLLAATVPDAYDSRGLLFAVTYVTLHLASGLYFQLVLPASPPKARGGRIVVWEALAAVPWILGGLAAGTTRAVLWAVGISVEYLGVSLGWPLPRSRRVPEPRLVGERISERYRQFVIIALGASIFIAGTSYSEHRYTVRSALALATVFMITVLMWRIYIYRAGELMTVALIRAVTPARLSQLTAVAHLIMVAGIVGTAATSQLVIGRPTGDTPPAWVAVILGGPALFLIGRGLLDYLVFGRVARTKVVGLVLLVVLAPAAAMVPPILVTLIAAVVLTAIAAVSLPLTRANPPPPAPPRLTRAA
ncbi:low temperature requirement protein A [Micromonospora sp. NPDC050417]|uniref:low temperature requirement protein A n=1 Tax=Micromonospora sp. NPDC050417 TaxID=3364280 RepID=UPI00379FD75D